MPAHDDGEGPDLGGPEHVGVAAGLGAALDDALVDRPELVHVVALVGAAAGVEEGEQARDQEGGFVVRDGVRPGEDGAGLAVEAAAIGEEDGILGGVLLGQHAALADEAMGDDRAVGDLSSRWRR